MQTTLSIIQIIFFALATITCMTYLVNQRRKLTTNTPNPLKIYQDVFDAINSAIKNKQPTLRYDVNHMTNDEFFALYGGIRKHYSALDMDIKVDFTYRTADHPNGGEYLLFETGKYNGAYPLELRLDTSYLVKLPQTPPPINQSNVVPLFRVQNKSKNTTFVPSIELTIREESTILRQGNVIDLQAYRNKKQIYRPSS